MRLTREEPRAYPQLLLTIAGMVWVGVIETFVLRSAFDFSLARALIPLACYATLGLALGVCLHCAARYAKIPPWSATVAPAALFSFAIIAVKENIVLHGSALSGASLLMVVFAILVCALLAVLLSWCFRSGLIPFSTQTHFFLITALFLPLFGVVEHGVYVGITASLWLALAHVFSCGAGMALGLGLAMLVYRLTSQGGARMFTLVCLCVILAAAIATLGPRIHTRLALAHYRNTLPPVPQPHETATPRPDIILIVADTLRKDRVSFYCKDNIETPAMDSLALDAQVFRNATTVAPWTLPSHASIFTGLYSSEHHANNSLEGDTIGHPLDDSAVTLAEILRTHGYRTGAVVANYSALGPYYNVQQGFDFYYCRTLFPPISVWGNILFGLGYEPFRLLGSNQIETVPELMPIIFEWIAQDRSRPFFLFINFMEPHGMEFIPWPVNRVIPYSLTSPARTDQAAQQVFHQELLSRKQTVQEWYDREVEWFDLQFGRFLDELKARDIYDPSWIVFLSDHGEMLGEHDCFGHERGLYEELLQVPLFLKCPAQWGRSPGAIDAHVELVDLMPEILNALGIEQPGPMSGRPFQTAQTAHHAELYPFPQYRNDGYLVSFQEDRFKLVKSTRAEPLLFDLLEDPRETKDLSREHPAKRALLEERITDWLGSLKPIQRMERKGPMPEDVKRSLKSLGYIQ